MALGIKMLAPLRNEQGSEDPRCPFRIRHSNDRARCFFKSLRYQDGDFAVELPCGLRTDTTRKAAPHRWDTALSDNGRNALKRSPLALAIRRIW